MSRPHVPVHRIRYDYAVNVTTGAWVQLDASLDAACSYIEIFDSSGQTMELGIGASGSESSLPFYIFPGGNAPQLVACPLPAGCRLAVKAVSGNATTGELTINFYQ